MEITENRFGGLHGKQWIRFPDGKEYLVPSHMVPALDQAFASYHTKLKMGVATSLGGVSDWSIQLPDCQLSCQSYDLGTAVQSQHFIYFMLTYYTSLNRLRTPHLTGSPKPKSTSQQTLYVWPQIKLHWPNGPTAIDRLQAFDSSFWSPHSPAKAWHLIQRCISLPKHMWNWEACSCWCQSQGFQKSWQPSGAIPDGPEWASMTSDRCWQQFKSVIVTYDSSFM